MIEQTPKEAAYYVGVFLLNALVAIDAEMKQSRRRVGLLGIKKWVEAALETHNKLYVHLLCAEAMDAKRTQGSA